MRTFDVIGSLFVATWVALAGLHVWRAEFREVEDLAQLDSGFVMYEGETWLTLQREQEDVGFVHQTRTRLPDGWLIEYKLLMAISLLGADRAIETQVKSTLDLEGFLRKFTADVQTGAQSFAAQGHVDGHNLTLTMDLGLNPQQSTIDLPEPPRLSASAINQLLANDSLTPGDIFEESYFDPTTMKMTKMKLEYVGPDEVEILGEMLAAHHVRQRVAGNELDVYVDDRGEILIQEFPLRMAGTRVPAEFGRARAAALRRKLEQIKKEAPQDGQANPLDLGLSAARNLLGGQLSLKDLAQAAQRPDPDTYILRGFDAEMELDLVSARQATYRDVHGQHMIETGPDATTSDTAAAEPDDLETYLAAGPRVDANSAAIAALVADSGAPADARRIGEAVAARLRVSGEAGISTASAALTRGHGDCTEHALVLVAALRHAQIPARFVSGVLWEPEEGFRPHQWVQYLDGGAWLDLDLTRDDRRAGPRHLQFYVHSDPEHPHYVHALDQLTLVPTWPAEALERDPTIATPDAEPATPRDHTP